MATSTKLVVRYNDVLETIDVDPTLAIQNPLLLVNNAFENNPAELSSAVVALNNFLKNKGSDIEVLSSTQYESPERHHYPLLQTMMFNQEQVDKIRDLYQIILDWTIISQEIIGVEGDPSFKTSIKIMVNGKTLEIPIGDVLSLKTSINANTEPSSGLLNVGGVGLPIRFETFFVGDQNEIIDASGQSSIPENVVITAYLIHIDRITEDLSTSLELYEPGEPIVIQITAEPETPFSVRSFPSQINAIKKWFGPDAVLYPDDDYDSYGKYFGYVDRIVVDEFDNVFTVFSNGGSYGTKVSLADIMPEPLPVADRSFSSLSPYFFEISGTVGKLEIPKYSGSPYPDDISTVLQPKEHQGEVRYYLNELLPYTMVFDAERNRYTRTNKIYPTPTEWGE